MTDVAQKPQDEKTFFGQPRVLANLFGVELWERFSFYGMQGILLLYLFYSTEEGGLGISQETAVGIVGAYGGLVYLSTIAGAWVADRLIGSERTLFYSAVLVMAGHIALSVIPGTLGVGVGLILIALGSGGVKANATSLVGTLYTAEDPRRDAGFALFYLGINLGALLGPLLTGWLQTSYGFHVGFAAAAVGMAIGLIQYTIGRKRLAAVANEVPDPLPSSKRLWYGLGILGAVVVVAVLSLTGVLRANSLDTAVIVVTVGSTLAYFAVILMSPHVTSVERKRVLAFIPMFIASAAFWSLYQQQFTVLTVYSNSQLNRDIFGWTMPVSWVQSINPVFIIILSGVFAAIWTKMGDRQPPRPEVRRRHGRHGDRLPALHPHGEHPTELRPAARSHRRDLRLHGRRAAAVTGRAVAHDQARARGVPHPDGRVVLPLGRPRHRPLRDPRGVLLGRQPGGLLRDPRCDRHRHRNRPRADDPLAQAPHGRSPLTLDEHRRIYVDRLTSCPSFPRSRVPGRPSNGPR